MNARDIANLKEDMAADQRRARAMAMLYSLLALALMLGGIFIHEEPRPSGLELMKLIVGFLACRELALLRMRL